MIDQRGIASYAGPVRGLRSILSAQREALAVESVAYWRSRASLVEMAINAYWRQHVDASEASGRLERRQERAGVAG